MEADSSKITESEKPETLKWHWMTSLGSRSERMAWNLLHIQSQSSSQIASEFPSHVKLWNSHREGLEGKRIPR